MSRSRIIVAAATAVCSIGSGAHAQYASTFDALNASDQGVVLTGQDGYYLPAGLANADFLAYTYAGNALGIPANPQGGAQFVAGTGPGSASTFARAQRDISWGTGAWHVTYDALSHFAGGTATNNLGSFSAQPYPGSASYIHLFSFQDVANPTAWRALYLAYTAAGVAHPQPGMSPGPEWENLSLDHWYRFGTTIDFDQNRITEVTITDLTTGQTTTATPADWYLEGGSAGGRPLPTGFRMFGGGSGPGNTTAWDNVTIEPAAGCPADFDNSGDLTLADFVAFRNAYVAGDLAADFDSSGTLTLADFVAFRNAYVAGCP